MTDAWQGIGSQHTLAEEDGKLHYTFKEDVNPVLQYCKEKRNTGTAFYAKDKSMAHVAEVPVSIIMQLKERGLDMFRHEDMPKIMAVIQEEYPHLKTTNMRIA